MKKNTSPIPRIAHFVYGLWDNDSELPLFFQNTIAKWKERGWDIRLWLKKDCETLINTHYPHYITAYFEHTPNPVQRADFIRYLIVYHCGGFYFDLDCVPGEWGLEKYLDNEWAQYQAIYVIEDIHTSQQMEQTRHFPVRNGIPEAKYHLANYAFGTVPRHSSVHNIIELVADRCIHVEPFHSQYYIFYTTGPVAVTDALHGMDKEKHHIFCIMPHETQWMKNKHLTHMSTLTWFDSPFSRLGT